MQINPGCTNKIYKRDLIVRNNLLQPERRYYEDAVFWLKSVYYSSTISTISDRLYYYRQRPGSNMKTLSKKHIDDRLEFIREIDRFVKDELFLLAHADVYSITNDALSYLLEHIWFGKSLIVASDEENNVDMERYYEEKIRDFTICCNWSALSTVYKYYRERIPLNKP